MRSQTSICLMPVSLAILPKQAKEIDPQQRLFLECAWELIERGWL